MTRDEAKELLPVLKAYSEGKTIQQITEHGYADIEDECFFLMHPDNYRIKPESEYRPFANADECWNEMLKHQPFGWLKAPWGVFQVTGINDAYVCLGAPNNRLSYDQLFNDYTFMDGAKFGTKVEK